MTRCAVPTAVHLSHRGKLIPLAVTVALALAACGSRSDDAPPPDPDPPPPARVMPTGRLSQPVDKGPLTHVTAAGWRTRIENGAITIQPPAGDVEPDLQYVAWRMHDQLGTHDLGAWSGGRRTLLLPGGAKITLQGQAGEIMRFSLYDGAESHEVDVLTQTLMHSRVDAGIAQTRESAEADGDSAALQDLRPVSSTATGRVTRLHLVNLYNEPADSAGAPSPRTPAVAVLGSQSAGDLEVVMLPPEPAPEADQPCTPANEPRGGLVRQGNGTLLYTTRSGAWTVHIDQHTITLMRSNAFKWEVWGDPHENLNGKHIKDWDGKRRTLLLDDGAKITLHADGPQQVVHTTSIHDGARSHEVGNIGNVVRHSCVNAQQAAARESAEADGETAHLANLRGPAAARGYLAVGNVYVEAEAAQAPAEPEFALQMLGETGDADAESNRVNDYYDDPRLGHT